MKKERGKWEGMLTIARLNFPFYLTAVGIAAGLIGFMLRGGGVSLINGLLISGCLYFIIISLVISHWVYDRSDLYRWKWLDRALDGGSKQNLLLCHSGFDEASGLLKRKFPNSAWMVLDHYNPVTMTEPSIRRARKRYPPTNGTLAARYNQWRGRDGSVDVIFGLLAIHELRSETERAAWFREAHRCLADGGRVIIVEHVRDFANFVAFGPGFLHFHTVASWRRSWEPAGLVLADTFRITPFVRVFVLQ